MKRTAVILATFLCFPPLAAETTMTPISDGAFGTLSGRVQSLSMYRDYDNTSNGANSSLGVVLGYTAPVAEGFEAALAYNYAGGIFENNNVGILANDDIHVLNEAWVRYTPKWFDSKTRVLLGRKVINGEVFRADDFRQKARSVEGIQLEVSDIADTRLVFGHAWRMSNWIQSGDKWDFRDFGDDTAGITWGEGVYRGLKNMEIALFDAYSWDTANLVGTRIKWNGLQHGALVAYYRHEGSVGGGAHHSADAFGISVPIDVGSVTVEPGYFTIHGDNLLFQEATTGINHPLGSSMMIYAKQFNGDTDTAYLKATTKVGSSAFYVLYNYTRQTQSDIKGQELNFVLKYSVTNNFVMALKSGIGKLDFNDSADATATDTRLFMTYQF